MSDEGRITVDGGHDVLAIAEGEDEWFLAFNVEDDGLKAISGTQCRTQLEAAAEGTERLVLLGIVERVVATEAELRLVLIANAVGIEGADEAHRSVTAADRGGSGIFDGDAIEFWVHLACTFCPLDDVGFAGYDVSGNLEVQVKRAATGKAGFMTVDGAINSAVGSRRTWTGKRQEK